MTGFLFQLTFLLATPFWATMIFLPNWRWTARIIASPLIVVPPLVIYLLVMLPIFPAFWTAVSAPDLGVLREVLGSANGAAAARAQLIAFDLFIGRWMFRDSRTLGVSGWVMGPLLLLTILLSPIGLLSYFVIRRVARRDRLSDDEVLSRPDIATTQHPVVD